MDHRLLIVDNNDSFTFNILESLRSITGNKPDVKNSRSLNYKTAAKYKAIIFSPGPGLPGDFPVMSEILSEYGGKIPILGICLGHQAICCHFDYSLYNLDQVVHGQSKKITVVSESKLFRNIPGSFEAGLYHSWSARNEKVNYELKITGLSEDGQIMAVENNDEMIFGVQFHPESHITPYGKTIFSNFLSVIR